MSESALIVCDGLLPEKEWINSRIRLHTFAVACDGAANVLISNGIFPQVIIGDLDSFNHTVLGFEELNSVLVIQDSDQETNDLEKALEFVFQKGIQTVELIGALGKRLDHTLKNLSVLQRYSTRFEQLYILDEWGIHFFGKSSTRIEAKTGTVLSMIPFNGRVYGIETEGLAYALQNEWLENGKRDGTSNELTAEKAIIKKTQGELLFSIQLKQQETFSFKVSSTSIELVIS